MIGRLSGILATKASDHVLIDVQGVGYVVHCAESFVSTLPAPGAPVTLYTEMLVREDLMQLIGFASPVEKEWYRLLISVQGVGTKAALAILGALGPEALGRAIALGDWAALRAAKGVGPKSAQRITHELAEKAALLAANPPAEAVLAPGPSPAQAMPVPAPSEPVPAPPAPAEPAPDNGQARRDALSALVNLGYAQPEAARALAQTDGTGDAPALIRAALKHLAPKG